MPKSSGGKHKASQDQAAGDGLVVLHRSHFVDWQPAPIVSLASSHDGSLAVAVRETGDMELYDTSNWHCFQTLPGAADTSTTCVAVVDEEGGVSCRLFTAGLDGAIQELDAESRRAIPGAACDSYGGAVWQLEPEPLGRVEAGGLPRLAAACDDGCVRLFAAGVGVPGVSYARSLPRVEGRALAVAWHPGGGVLASAGTDGCIHVWGLDGGRELLRITAGDTSSRRDHCVWDLLYLPDGTLVSADSDGAVQFWDGQHGTLLRRFTQHAADVLRLAASPDGRTVFAAGVDPQLAVFQLVQGSDGTPQWAYLSSKRLHTHDVRAMCVVHGKHMPEAVLLTGGNDTQLLGHSVGRFLKEHPLKLNPCPQRPLCQISSPAVPAAAQQPGGRRGGGAQQQQQQQQQQPAPRLLCCQRNQLDVWQLGTAAGGRPGALAQAAGEEAAEGVMVPPGGRPVHLARFQARGGFLTAAALAPGGDLVAFSDARGVRAFQLAERPLPGGSELAGAAAGAPAALGVSPLPLPADLPPASHLLFLPGSSRLVACALDGSIRVLDLGGSSEEGGGSGGSRSRRSSSSSVVHVIKDVHNLRHKVWAKRERHRSAARRWAPSVDLLAASPDGRWLGVAARQRVHAVDLHAQPRPALTQLPPPSEPARPISALAFSADSVTLLVATAAAAAPDRAGGAAKSSSSLLPGSASPACQLAAYDVAAGQLTNWAKAHGEELAQQLSAFPGPVSGVACSPAAPTSLLLTSSAAICHLDMAKPLAHDPAAAVGAKRRRGPIRPLLATAPAGVNCRILYADDPVLYVQYLAPDAVLVVEKAWSDVWQKLPAPVYRHRYGT